MTSGGMFNILVRFAVTFDLFSQIFDSSKSVNFQRCSCFVKGRKFLCFSSKCNFMKYFHIAGSVFEQMGH